MGIIQIDENTRIEMIPNNYVLQYRVRVKRGGFRWSVDGYFPTLEQCATEALNQAPAVAISATSDLKELIKVIQDENKKLMVAIKGRDKEHRGSVSIATISRTQLHDDSIFN